MDIHYLPRRDSTFTTCWEEGPQSFLADRRACEYHCFLRGLLKCHNLYQNRWKKRLHVTANKVKKWLLRSLIYFKKFGYPEEMVKANPSYRNSGSAPDLLTIVNTVMC
ncbi:hypothetical protein ACF0H5_006513 [Mactra antiquata]